jgi:S-formylglutathione hydrolase FrmB
MPWTSVALAGKSVDWFVPAQPRAGRTAVFLHGYDGVTLRDNPHYTAEFEKHALRVLCPHGRRCWWSDAVYAPFDPDRSPVQFLSREIPEFLARIDGDAPASLGVFGVEMGGQGALQLAYRRARLFPVVVAVSPKVDFEEWHGHGTSLDEMFPDREAARQATAILHVHPLDWPKHQLLLCDPADHYCLDGVLTLASKLSSSGIPFESDFATTHGGYGWEYANAVANRVVGYLAERLEQPSRQIG